MTLLIEGEELTILSKRYDTPTYRRMVEQVAASERLTEALIKLTLTYDIKDEKSHNAAKWSSYILSELAKHHPIHAKKYAEALAQKLPSSKDQTTLRHVLRFFQFTGVPESAEGLISTQCFDYLTSDSNASIAVKVFAMTLLFYLSQKYPEFKDELQLIIEDQIGHSTAGFKSRSKKILKAWQTGSATLAI